MKIKKIAKILCICIIALNFFGILTIMQIYSYSEEIISFIYSQIAINLVIIDFVSTSILISIAFLSLFWKKNAILPSILLFIVMGLQIFILLYNSFINPYFWFSDSSYILEIQIIAILTALFSFCTATLIRASGLPFDKKKVFICKFKTIFESIMLKIILVWVYLPIIVGILFEMVIQFSIAYLSWIIFNSWSRQGWINSWIVIFHFDPSFRIDILFIAEIFIFTIGFLLFLYGLVFIVKARKNRIDLIQKGPYKYIRHPQNLGILIMMFPFALYTPWIHDIGIRIGDILSWTLFCLVMIFCSDFEEIRMKKGLSEEYENYRLKTGFFIPKLRHQKINQAKDTKLNYLKRYCLLILGYFIFILIIFFIVQDLLEKGYLIQTL